MAFGNSGYPVISLAPSGGNANPGAPGGRALLGLMRDADQARVGYVLQPFKASSGTGTFVYSLPGVNYFSFILSGTLGSASITLWGSHTNAPGSWVAVGSAITTLGETIITGKFYKYFAISVDTAGTSLTLDVLAIRV
jgi:hypothetical protein